MKEEPLKDFAKEHNLTPRETDLLNVVAIYGYSNEEIATELKIQKKTVNIHMSNLLLKTKSASSRELLSKIITNLLPSPLVEGEYTNTMESNYGKGNDY
jgi:DNA-binding NarL/FixJ family response regulator